MIISQLYGNTNTTSSYSNVSFIGNSSFLFRPTFSISEGVDFGSTTEYQYIGEFESNNISKGVYSQEVIDLELNHRSNNYSNYKSLFSVGLYALINEYATFTEQNDITLIDADSSGNYGVSSGLVFDIPIGENTNGMFYYTTERPFNDGVIKTVFSGISTTSGQRLSYTQLIRNGGDKGFYTRVDPLTNTVRLEYFNTSGTTILTQVTGVSYRIGTYLSLVSSVFDNRIVIAGSTDGNNYNRHIDYTGLNNLNSGGLWGFGYGCSSISTVETLKLNEIHLQEIGSEGTLKDSIKTGYGLIGFEGVTYGNILPELNRFEAFAGSSWALTSNTVTRTSSGLSRADGYDKIISPGALLYGASVLPSDEFSNFMFETNVIGLSGVKAGLMTGQSYYWAGVFNFSGVTEDFVIVGNGASSGSAWYRSLKFNCYPVKVSPGVTYKLSMSRRGDTIRWYLNDSLVAGVYNDFTTLLQPRIGFAVSTSYGGSVSFVNPRVHFVSKEIGSQIIPSNSQISSLINSNASSDLLKKIGDDVVYFGSYGESVGEMGMSEYFWNDNYSSERSQSKDYFISTNKGGYYIGSTRLHNVDSVSYQNIDYYIDNSATDDDSSRDSLTEYAIKQEFSNENLSVSSLPVIGLQNGDRVSLSNDIIYQGQNASNMFKVISFTKSFDSSGKFTQSINLGRI